MGVKVRFWKGAWWVFVNHAGRRKAKHVGDRETAMRVAQAIRERLARGELHLQSADDRHTLAAYVTTWVETVRGVSKHRLFDSTKAISSSTFCPPWGIDPLHRSVVRIVAT